MFDVTPVSSPSHASMRSPWGGSGLSGGEGGSRATWDGRARLPVMAGKRFSNVVVSAMARGGVGSGGGDGDAGGGMGGGAVGSAGMINGVNNGDLRMFGSGGQLGTGDVG